MHKVPALSSLYDDSWKGLGHPSLSPVGEYSQHLLFPFKHAESWKQYFACSVTSQDDWIFLLLSVITSLMAKILPEGTLNRNTTAGCSGYLSV